MSAESEMVLAAALALPPTDRAALVEAILASFDCPARAETDAAWAVEAEDRIDAFERGELQSAPAAEVFERIDRRGRG
ncbi:MAG: addiction module protein [Armatimonadetes bacterium]|nr:addiction module protein [Armatimonadota bacterium]